VWHFGLSPPVLAFGDRKYYIMYFIDFRIPLVFIIHYITCGNFHHDLILHYITLHAEIYSARSYEEKIDRACIT